MRLVRSPPRAVDWFDSRSGVQHAESLTRPIDAEALGGRKTFYLGDDLGWGSAAHIEDGIVRPASIQ